MVFADWTFTQVTGTAAWALDAATKYAGNSSAKISLYSYSSPTVARATHDTFSEPMAQVICWVRHNTGNYGSIADCKIRLSTYGAIGTASYATVDTWEKFRFTFWYDVTTNTKFGRLEKYVGAAWVQQGSDTNFGTGSPSSGQISLEGRCEDYRGGEKAWFDEVEVSS